MRRQRKACADLATSRVFAGLANAERAHTAALSGHVREAQEAMAEADRLHEETMAVLYPWLEHARCWVQASLGEVERAAEMALELAARLRGDSLTAHEVIALHDAARLGRAEAAVDRLSEITLLVDGPVAPCMAAHASAAVKHDGLALLDAADGFAELDLYLHAAEAAAAACNRLHQTRSGELHTASERLAAYLEHCDDPHTPGLVVSRPALSERELQIARLAATGVTSREIASLLFLSSRTIDNHLRSVYDKLGISGRGELAAALRAIGPHRDG
jgi:DNA-binding CsgD family transcriptional regulator